MHQFGFRKCHSTDLALVAVNQYICTQLVNKKVVVGIQIDLSKAFDTINIQILKRKLTKYGIRGIPNLWISNYLTNRIQRTNFKNQLSSQGTPTTQYVVYEECIIQKCLSVECLTP